MFEAFVGALYLTCGHDAAYVFVQNVFREHFDWADLDKWDVCMYKRRISATMKGMHTRPVFVRLTPPAHPQSPTGETIGVCLKDTTGKVWGVGKGSNRKEAELAAMRRAWEKLNMCNQPCLKDT
jgi:dsRNA-specific ribonuclease